MDGWLPFFISVDAALFSGHCNMQPLEVTLAHMTLLTLAEDTSHTCHPAKRILTLMGTPSKHYQAKVNKKYVHTSRLIRGGWINNCMVLT